MKVRETATRLDGEVQIKVELDHPVEIGLVNLFENCEVRFNTPPLEAWSPEPQRPVLMISIKKKESRQSTT